jgi:hypothetical protein
MACQVTAGSGMSRGLEDALETKVQGKCEGKKILVFCFKNYSNYSNLL